MNAKIVFAVFLALQVSLALSDAPQPDQDVVDKYNEYKATFARRIENLWNKIKTSADTEQAQGAAERADKGFTALKIVAKEASPLLDSARSGALGVYSQYLRPYIGPYVQRAIDEAKVVLDQVMPAE